MPYVSLLFSSHCFNTKLVEKNKDGERFSTWSYSLGWGLIVFLVYTFADYLFSNEHINFLITYSFDFRHEELLSYYISFLRCVIFFICYSALLMVS